ncbi:aminotransferase class I/II-fold pyridoxal phosphate-dependent enzyme [Aestuariispira insulae]|uniref:N-succinyldiaminopimelate aminotransferase n=1 Tax=Aestuariispira insulae TaxID=1461337 RepID=A0A3D9HPT0_9PROT|nr:aminotransferase class I/II-fold pyridoxal phosphate-dependent enzyme [Aestuariispira insulae]RED51321.1 N-succinyldiaminopimelate aminotransferase [Aestuariispira insulae]
MPQSELTQLHDYPYRRLAALLGDAPAGMDVINTHIGEPQNPAPAMVADTVAQHADLWSKYPPLKGTADYRQAVADFLTRRYRLDAGFIDPDKNILPVAGTREALFQTALLAASRKRDRLDAGQTPIICLPNPLYHVYFGGALMAHAEIIAVDAVAENNFVPDYEALSPEILDRIALVYLCSPGNPTGTVASLDRLKAMITAARRHDFILAVDECYSEIWFDTPPAGGVEACAALGGGLENVIVLNSLSKRSSAPGLRCGFVAGEAGLMEDFAMLRGYGGVQVPGPLMAAGTALWQDERHAQENRDLYANLVATAERILGEYPGFQRPEAAFFLWLDVSHAGLTGEEAAKRLWEEQALKCLPGRYMSRRRADNTSPGDAFIRVALVHDNAIVEEACRRIAAILEL